MTDAFGFAAAILTSLAFLPQVLKVWRTRSAEDLSVGMLAAQTTGVALWLVYGIGVGSAPVIFSNTVTLLVMFMLIVLKRRYSTA